MSRLYGRVGLGLLAGTVSLLASCQAVFTFSPLSFLQRNPADLSAAQQVSFAQEALASGDSAAVAAAYETIAAQAEANPNDPAIQYLAGQLALEVSGVGAVFDSLLAGVGGGGGDLLDIDPAMLSGINQDVLGQAGAYLLAADSLDADLTSTDYLVGAVGLMVAGTPDGGDVVGSAADNPNADAAAAFLAAGVDELPEGDPAAAVLLGVLLAFEGGGG